MAIQSNFPAIKPSLLLDFANTKQLDPRITFTRASTATYYDGVTTTKAEENLFTYSQDFDNSAWAKVSASVTANAAVAPDVTTTAELVYPSSTGTYRSIQQNIATNASLSILTTTASKTISFFAKASGFSWVFTADSSSGLKKCFFDLTNGITGTTAANHTTAITSVGNGWYRCVVTTSEQYTGTITIAVADADNSATATASGTNGIYLWGAQIEQRSSVTAYTATTTQPITNYIPKLQTAASGVARFDNNPTTDESLGLLIEEQRTNLLTYSEQFDNAAWTKTRSSITANMIVAPDGTLTGDKLVEDTTASTTHLMTQQRTGLSAGAAYTFSVYAKAGERSRFYMMEGNNTTGQSWFDLSTGTIVSTTGNGSPISTITPVGNGWYKCTLTLTLVGTAHNCQIRLTTSTTDVYTGDGYSGIYIWGAQLEAGSFATSYIPTVASQVTRSADAASMTGTNFSTWFNQADGTLYAEGLSLGSPNRNLLTVSDGTNNNAIEMYRVNSSSSASMYVARDGAAQVNINITGSFPAGSFIKMSIGYQGNNSNAAANGTLGTLDTVCSIPAVNQLRIGTSGAGSSAHLAGTIKKIAYYPVRVTDAQLQALTS